jgi:hypothetical protein
VIMRPDVIIKMRCPHTGVVNFFTEADPLLAVGCVTERARSHFAWHCHLDDPASGVASDMGVAEAHLRNAIAARRDCRRDFLVTPTSASDGRGRA